MNLEEIIKHDIELFCEDYENGSIEYNELEGFQYKLKKKLSSYHESLEKLLFLHGLTSNFTQYYSSHLKTCTYKDTPDKCYTNIFYSKGKYIIEQEIKKLNPSFDYTILRPQVNSSLIKSNLVDLNSFPKTAILFQSAIDKLNEGRNERNLLDDLRLSLETLLKEKFSNNKSMENQMEILGTHLKEKGTSKEVVNMFRTLFDYYAKYQNSYVKHNDNVKKEEVDLLINLTSAFINFLLHT